MIIFSGFSSSSDCLSDSNPVAIEYRPYTNATANCANFMDGTSRMIACSGTTTPLFIFFIRTIY
jgi:hypothetical protein